MGEDQWLQRLIRPAAMTSTRGAAALPMPRLTRAYAFRSRLIKCVCATPTLAAGVNTPSRRVVVRDWQRYDGTVGGMEPVLRVDGTRREAADGGVESCLMYRDTPYGQRAEGPEETAQVRREEEGDAVETKLVLAGCALLHV